MGRTAKGNDFETIYGQNDAPTETPELLQSKLLELDQELEKLPAADKQGWMQAQEKCPDLVNDDHKLQFLRCEVMNVVLAAERLVRYWDTRIDIFGLDKAFLPLTLDEALKDDSVALNFGFIRVVPAKDPAGRGIVFVDPSRQDKTQYERKSMTRGIWYGVNALLEDEEIQRKGIVLVAYPRNVGVKHMDRPQVKMNIDSLKGCLPIRVAAFHVCHPPTFFSMVFPVVKLFLGDRMKKRMKVESGSDEKVLEKLGKYGLTRDKLPTDIGGILSLDHEAWLLRRRQSGM